MGWLNINGNWIGRNSGVSWKSYWTEQYKDIYNTFPVKPAKEIAILQNAMMVPIIASGAWDVLDWFVCIANDNEASSRLDWKSLTKTLTDIGTGITWSALKGLKGSGTGYVDTQFIPAVDGVHIGREDACYGYFANLNPSAGDQVELAGLYDIGQVVMLYSKFTNGKAYVRTHNPTTYLSIDVADRIGTYIANRVEVGKQQYYKNNNKIIDGDLVTTASIPNSSLKLLSGGFETSMSLNELSFAFAGKGLTVVQVGAITDALQLYNDSVAYFFDE